MFPVLPALQHRQDNLFLAGYSVSVPIELRRIARLTSVEGCRTCCLCGGAVRIVGVGFAFYQATWLNDHDAVTDESMTTIIPFNNVESIEQVETVDAEDGDFK